MLYYNFHIGDFIKKTIHLSDEEELAYRRLIDWYYMKETPLPKSTKGVAKIARCKIRVAEAVLNEFFELTEEGWSNSRCDKEIDNYYEKRRKCSIAGKKSGKARKRTDVQRTLNGRSTDAPTDVEPAINHNPESKRSSKHKDSKSKTTPQDTSSLTSRQKSILQEFSNEKYFIRVQGMGDVTIIKSLDDPIMAAKVLGGEQFRLVQDPIGLIHSSCEDSWQKPIWDVFKYLRGYFRTEHDAQRRAREISQAEWEGEKRKPTKAAPVAPLPVPPKYEEPPTKPASPEATARFLQTINEKYPRKTEGDNDKKEEQAGA